MRNITRAIALAALAAGWLLAACAPAQAAEPRPPDIAYGQDLCDTCGMIIGEARFAAASLTTDGRAHSFDDIGDMLAYHREHPEEQVRAWFVHDYESEAWLRGETAFYVASAQIASPMGHGLAAFADGAAAEAFARERGAEAVAFEELQAAAPTAAHGH